jgi:hypothetical protein
MLEGKLVSIGAVLMLGLLRLEAHTNVYIALNTSFRLTAQAQASPESITTVTITTKDLIQAIGAATTNQFSPQAKLVLLFRVLGGVPFFVIRDGTNEVNTAEFLTASQIGTPIARLKQGPVGLITGTVFVEEGFRLVNLDALDFEVQGFNLARQSNRWKGIITLPVYGPTSLYITVAGPGTVAGNPAVVHGFVTAAQPQFEFRLDDE